MVKVFDESDGFISRRKSNEADVKMRYDYYFTLAHKVYTEARMIAVKKRVDPDRTAMSYLIEKDRGNDEEGDYVLDSDYSSELSEKDLADLEN